MSARLEQFIRDQLAILSLPVQERSYLQEELERSEQRRLSPEFLEAEWERQVERHIELGFHKHRNIRLSRGKFKDAMPRFSDQPEEYRGHFDIPVLVIGKIPPADQYKLDGVEYYLSGLSVKDWEEDPLGFRTPDVIAYATWSDDGSNHLGKAVKDVRSKSIGEFARGATVYDGSGLYIARLEILNDHFLDFPGTRVESVHAPYLGLWHDGPELHYNWIDGAYPRLGSVLCGRKIVTG